MVISILDLNAGNLDLYRDAILKSEKLFPKSIRMDWEELETIISGDRPVAKVGLVGSLYAGNMLGCCLTPEEIEEMDIPGMVHDPGRIYGYNIVVLPKFRKYGLGLALLRSFLKSAKGLGYQTLEGHANPMSLPLIRRYAGVKELETSLDWDGIGTPYVHFVLPL